MYSPLLTKLVNQVNVYLHIPEITRQVLYHTQLLLVKIATFPFDIF